MIRYVQTNEGGKVIGVSFISGPVSMPRLVQSDSAEMGDEVDANGDVVEAAGPPERYIRPRHIVETVTPAEMSALLNSNVPEHKTFLEEVRLINAAGEMIRTNHPRFLAGLAMLQADGIFSAESVSAVKAL